MVLAPASQVQGLNSILSTKKHKTHTKNRNKKKNISMVIKCVLISEISRVKNVDLRPDKLLHLLHLKESSVHEAPITGQRTGPTALGFAMSLPWSWHHRRGIGRKAGVIYMRSLWVTVSIHPTSVFWVCRLTELFCFPFPLCLVLELEAVSPGPSSLLIGRDLERGIKSYFLQNKLCHPEEHLDWATGAISGHPGQ